MDRKKQLEDWRSWKKQCDESWQHASDSFSRAIDDLAYDLYKNDEVKEKCKCCKKKLRINQQIVCNLCMKGILKLKDEIAEMGKSLKDLDNLKK